MGAVGIMVLNEAVTPGSAAKTTEAIVNTGAPAVQGAGLLGGEALAATEPMAAGARQAMNGLGTAVGPGTTEDTLPVTPLGG